MTPTPDRSLVWVANEAPTTRWPSLRATEVWKHRELIYFFALRDVQVRYKQAFLGVAWAVIQPLVGALMFTVLFNRLADIDLGGRSYFAFALVGFSVWTYFSTTTSEGSNSLLYNSDLLTKVAFPKVVAPMSAMLPGLIDLGVGAVLAFGVAVVEGDNVNIVGMLVGLPAGLVLLVATTAGPTLFFSASIVKYRDMTVAVTFGLQVLLFASPIAYPVDLYPERWQTVAYLNPLTGCLGLLRSALTGSDFPGLWRILLSALTAAAFLTVGLFHFRRNEREFADII